MNSTIMKVIAWIYAVLGVIGSFIMGAKIKDLLHISGAGITIIGIISTVFCAIVLFAIAKILENTEYSAEKISALEREIKRLINAANAPEGASNSKMSLSSITSKSSGSEWRCPECGKTNPTSNRTCKDCGYQK